MFKKLCMLLLLGSLFLVMESSAQAQFKKLKFPYKDFIYEGSVFGGNFNAPSEYKGSYYGGKVAVRIANPTKKSNLDRKFFFGGEVLYVPYRFDLLDSSTKGGGKGHITEAGLSFQWFRFKETSLKNTKFNAGGKYITQRLAYETGNTKYETVQSNWLLYMEFLYDVVKTTGIINKVMLGSRYEYPFENFSFQSQKTVNGVTIQDLDGQPTNRKMFQAWLEFGPIIPLDREWSISTLLHAEYKHKSDRQQDIFSVGGVLGVNNEGWEIFRIGVVPEFSKAPKPTMVAYISGDFLNICRRLFSNL